MSRTHTQPHRHTQTRTYPRRLTGLASLKLANIDLPNVRDNNFAALSALTRLAALDISCVGYLYDADLLSLKRTLPLDRTDLTACAACAALKAFSTYQSNYSSASLGSMTSRR